MEAETALKARVHEGIAGAENFRDAVHAAMPSVDVTLTQPFPGQSGWPRDVVEALREKARQPGVMDRHIRDAAPPDGG